MSAPQPTQPKRVPLGPVLEWSDAELDALSQVGPDDLTAAAEWFREHAPPRFKRLLEAETVEDVT